MRLMKSSILAMLSLTFFSVVVLAQVDPSKPVDNLNDLLALYASMKGSTLGIIILVTQALMFIFNKIGWFDKAWGGWKLVTVSGLSIALSVLVALFKGGSIGSILFDAGFLMSTQVFINQIAKQLKKTFNFLRFNSGVGVE